jgi:hypothetical protein
MDRPAEYFELLKKYLKIEKEVNYDYEDPKLKDCICKLEDLWAIMTEQEKYTLQHSRKVSNLFIMEAHLD